MKCENLKIGWSQFPLKLLNLYAQTGARTPLPEGREILDKFKILIV